MKNIKKYIIFSFTFLLLVLVNSYIKVNALEDHMVNSNFTYIYTTNVNDPITLEELIDEIDLNAYDSNGNNITSQIIVSDPGTYISAVLNKPTTQNITLGNYLVKYAVYDDYGKRSIFKVYINVVDTDAPVIGEDSITVYEFNKLEVNEATIDLIKYGLDVRDNHDIDLTYEFEEGFDLLDAMGDIRVYLYISDKSENTSRVALELSIYDTVGPKIYADTTYLYTTNTDKVLEFEEILDFCNIYAMDLDTALYCDIFVEKDNYTPNFDKSGIYTINAYAEDINNNRTSFFIYIEVEDDVDPKFFLDSTKVTINCEVTFNLEKADELIKSRKMARNDNYELSLISDDYTINKEKTGTYSYKVKAKYEDDSESIFEFIITVEEKIEEEPIIEEQQLTFEEKLSKGFKIVWKIVKWPFEKLTGFVRKILKKSLLFKK